jgi:hypothetical protein
MEDDTRADTQQGDLIRFLLIFQNKEGTLKKYVQENIADFRFQRVKNRV